MSTLNMPTVIARLQHGSQQEKHSQQKSYKALKLPQLVKHVGVGDRIGLNAIRRNAYLYKQPIYLDQVFRSQNHHHAVFDIRKTYGKRFGENRRPARLPKLSSSYDPKAPLVFPTVLGKRPNYHSNVEKLKRNITYEDREEDDDDSQWARRAIEGTTSREIVKVYENQAGIKKRGAHRYDSTYRIADRGSSSRGRETNSTDISENSQDASSNRIVFNKTVVDNQHTDERSGEDEDERLESQYQRSTQVNFLAVDCNASPQNNRIPIERRKLRVKLRPIEEHSRGLAPIEKGQSEGRRPNANLDLKSVHGSEAKTKSGKKLLTSLLGRLKTEERQEKKAQGHSKHSIQDVSNSVLYSEYYISMKEKIESNLTRNNRAKKYGSKIEFDKLPADLVGHHFQQTYENLWKYLNQNGKISSPSTYFPSKGELHQKRPDMIYIPTGRPEETLFIEGLHCNDKNARGKINPTGKFKYNHRNNDENDDMSRSKDTSPWDIDEELKTPKNHDREMRVKPPNEVSYVNNVSLTASELSSTEYTGIRKLSVTLPHLGVTAPPCSPASTLNYQALERTNTPNGSWQEPCEVCGYHGSKSEKKFDGTLLENERSYPTPKTDLTFTSAKNDDQKSPEKNVGKKKTKKTVATAAVTVKSESDVGSKKDRDESKQAKKSRVYKHGQYRVKVEEAIIERRRSRYPLALTNMLTKPYTFSYIPGISDNLSSQSFSGKIANLPIETPADVKANTKLVSEIQKVKAAPRNSTIVSFEDNSSMSCNDNSGDKLLKKDASTQLDGIPIKQHYDYGVLHNVERVADTVAFPVLPPIKSKSDVFESPRSLQNDVQKTDVAESQQNMEYMYNVLKQRPMTEGAKRQGKPISPTTFYSGSYFLKNRN